LTTEVSVLGREGRAGTAAAEDESAVGVVDKNEVEDGVVVEAAADRAVWVSSVASNVLFICDTVLPAEPALSHGLGGDTVVIMN
jgi:hypothetical protein